MPVDRCREAGVDQRCRVMLLDDGGAIDERVGGQERAVVDGAVDEAAELGKVDLAPGLEGCRCGPGREQRARARPGDVAHRRQAQRHQLDRLSRRRVAVGAIVLPVEPRQRVIVERDRELVALADVSQIDGSRKGHVPRGDTGAGQRLSPGGLQPGEGGLEVIR